MRGILAAEWLKMQRTWIFFLIVLGPLGVVSLDGVRYAVAYDRLVPPGAEHWLPFINSIHHLLYPSLMLGTAIVASLLASIEHRGDAWKYLLALPVAKWQIYLAKFIWLLLLLVAAGALVFVGATVLGWLLGFGGHYPWMLLLKEAWVPVLCALPVMAFQLALSVLIRNQAAPIIAGIVGMLLGFAYMPWSLPNLAGPLHTAMLPRDIKWSLLSGVTLLVLGAAAFQKREY